MVGSVDLSAEDPSDIKPTMAISSLPWLSLPFGRAPPMGWQGTHRVGRFCHEPGLYHESLLPENQAFGFIRCHDDHVMVAKPLCMA